MSYLQNTWGRSTGKAWDIVAYSHQGEVFCGECAEVKDSPIFRSDVDEYIECYFCLMALG